MSEVITAGSLQQRVTLVATDEHVTTRGGLTAAAQILARRLPARVQPRPGVAPKIRGEQIDPRNEYDVVIRYREGVTTRLQVRYHARGGDRALEVLSVVDLAARHRFLQLLCREAA